MRSIADWQELLDNTEILCYGQPLPKPTAEMITAFERNSGFALPIGYVRYCQVFGVGELGEVFKIRCPGFADEFGWHADLGAFNNEMHAIQGDDGWAIFSDPEKARRLVYFADTFSGDMIGWDPKDVRDAVNHENGIFVVFRDNQEVCELACSFDDLVDHCWLGDRWFELTSFRPPRTFRLYAVQE